LPRLDYSGGATCPKLLLEPQRQNVCLWSEQINNAAWNKINLTVSANQASAPDGTTSADLVYPTTTGAGRLLEQYFVAGSGQTWTSSFFVKASGFSWVLIYSPTGGGTSWFNASTGVFGTVAAGSTATVLGQFNGFWRISITATLVGTTAYFYGGPADANGTTTATVNGTDGLLIWGAQTEQASYATSYINTLNSAVTRGADSVQGLFNGDSIFSTNWTAFCELVVPYVGNSGTSAGFGVRTVESSATSANWSFILAHGSATQLKLISYAPTTDHLFNYDFGDNLKVLVRSDGYYFINGIKYTFSNLSATEPVEVGFGRAGTSDFSAGESAQIKQTLIFPTALTDAQCIELTTL
jgi:hypothetical protein